MGQVLSPCQSQSATTKAVATTPRTVAGSFSPEQKERTTSVLKDVLPPPLSIAMTKSDSSSELTEEKPINEATILFNESDRASTEVDLPLPEVENMKVEEETSSEDLLVAIDKVSSVEQEVQPLPESTDVPSVLTEALEIPKDEAAVDFEVTSEDFAAINEVSTKKEVQHQVDTKDTLSVLTVTETVESPKDEFVVGESSEASESVERDSTMLLVTNKTEKFSIFDVYEADYNRESSTSPSITTEAEVQVPQTNQSMNSLLTNDSFPLELTQTAKFAVFGVKA